MDSRKFLMEMFLADARFPDEKFWNKDGSAIHADPKGPPKGTIGTVHADYGAKDQDDPVDSIQGKKNVYFGYDPADYDNPPDVPYEVADADDKRDPWNGGYPGAIDALEHEMGIDAHDVGFWQDADGKLNIDHNGHVWHWDGRTWEYDK